jgi:hypothetical protein
MYIHCINYIEMKEGMGQPCQRFDSHLKSMERW